MTSLPSGMPFRGSSSVEAGLLTPHSLRTGHRRQFPDVYVDASAALAPIDLVRGAALWAPPGSVLGGSAAALLHGERWYAPVAVTRSIDVYALGTPHVPKGIRLRRLRRPLPAHHVTTIGGISATTPARAAIDLARWETVDDRSICLVDAVCNRARIPVDEVRTLAVSISGLHGLRRVRSLLRWCDHRADSPQETRLRLLVVRSDLLDPTPQLRIRNEFGAHVATADLGYAKEKVAIFYDGEVHREKRTWEFDARVNAELSELGWGVLRVTSEMMRSPRIVLRRIEAALERGRTRS